MENKRVWVISIKWDISVPPSPPKAQESFRKWKVRSLSLSTSSLKVGGPQISELDISGTVWGRLGRPLCLRPCSVTSRPCGEVSQNHCRCLSLGFVLLKVLKGFILFAVLGMGPRM